MLCVNRSGGFEVVDWFALAVMFFQMLLKKSYRFVPLPGLFKIYFAVLTLSDEMLNLEVVSLL